VLIKEALHGFRCLGNLDMAVPGSSMKGHRTECCVPMQHRDAVGEEMELLARLSGDRHVRRDGPLGVRLKKLSPRQLTLDTGGKEDVEVDLAHRLGLPAGRPVVLPESEQPSSLTEEVVEGLDKLSTDRSTALDLGEVLNGCASHDAMLVKTIRQRFERADALLSELS
jgi:hypothetical protein